MTILDTNTVTITRPPAKVDSLETAVSSTVATGVRGRISGVSGSESQGLGTQEAVSAKFIGDVAVDVRRQDQLTDESTGDVWDVAWVRVREGLGLDHLVAGLNRSKGAD